MAEQFSVAYLLTEVRLVEPRDAEFYSTNPTADNAWAAAHLPLAPRVVVLARVAEDAKDDGPRVDGPRVDVRRLPDYKGLRGLLRELRSILGILGEFENTGIVVGRVPEVLSMIAYARCRLKNVPFLAYVVADAETVGRQIGGRWLGNLTSRVYRKLTCSVILHSVGTIYVTQQWLQERYPPPQNRPTLSRSNVQLDSRAFREPTQTTDDLSALELVTVGTLSRTKGQDLLVEALAALRDIGINAHLSIVGAGAYHSELRRLTEELGIEQAVTFLGSISDRDDVRAILDAADIFVFGSRSEGLPRAVIEAMARGLPVVATRAGGTHELISPDCLVDIDDREGLVRKIADLSRSARARYQKGHANYLQAKTIATSLGEDRRRNFLEQLRP